MLVDLCLHERFCRLCKFGVEVYVNRMLNSIYQMTMTSPCCQKALSCLAVFCRDWSVAPSVTLIRSLYFSRRPGNRQPLYLKSGYREQYSWEKNSCRTLG